MASGFHNVPTDDLSTWSNVQGTERSIKLKGLEEMSQYVVGVVGSVPLVVARSGSSECW